LSSPDWWKRFFTGPWLEVQKGFDRPAKVQPEADFIERALELEPGSRLLDVPCGEGRLARELARRGHRVTGVDLSAALIRHGLRLAAREGLDPDLRQGDMRRLRWRGSFDGAFCWWGSFGYFDEAGNRAFLRGMARALRPGGLFLLDCHSCETLFPDFAERQWVEVDDTLVLTDNLYDPETGRIETRWAFPGPGGTRRSRSSTRLYSLLELKGLLVEAGFGETRAWGDLDGEPFALGSARLLLAARRDGENLRK